MTFDSTFSSIRAARMRPALVAAALLLPAAVLPAQWSSNPLKNTFAAANCPVPPAAFPPGTLALEPVLVPCNRGCFFAWIDPAGAINIQAIDDCGYRKLASPFVIAGTSNGGLLHFTQLAGCAYANNDGAKNELFLAYTAMGTGGFEELRANVFTYDVLAGVPTITPGTAIVLHTTSSYHNFVMPCVDSRFVSAGVDGPIDGAVVGWRDWGFINSTLVDIYFAGVAGPAATPTLLGPVHHADSFTVNPGDQPARVSVVSDHLGNLYGAWRGNASGTWYHMGTRVNPIPGTAMGGWPTIHYTPVRLIDDWVLAADLQGGVFFAQTDPNGTNLVAGYNDGTGSPVGWSNLLTVATVTAEPVYALAMVGIDAASSSARAALAYRDNTAVRLAELSVTALVLTSPNDIALRGESALATIRGCAVFADKGVAVGWHAHSGNGAPRRLYGQEVETTNWSKLWNSGNARLVSDNPNAAEVKFAPQVVAKYGMPEVIYGWVDQRTNPEAQGPGGYVQSVADDYLQLLNNGFKKVDGKLGSSVWCIDMAKAFDLRGLTFVVGDPGDPHVGKELLTVDLAEGTFDVVKDINPGPAGSDPGPLVVHGTQRVFAATTASAGREPWVTDGTAAGTMQLADCQPGPGGSSPTMIVLLGTAEDGPMVFAAANTSTGRELWHTDGTPAGTAMITDLLPGAGDGVASTEAASLGGLVYFWGNDGVHGVELWRTDGTAAGTTMVADLVPGAGSAGPGSMLAVGDRLVFRATGAGIGAEPHAFDPATNTVTLLGDLAPGAGSSDPDSFAPLGNRALFSANTIVGRELWCTDGTAAGTHFVADLDPFGSSNPRDFTDIGSCALFCAGDAIHGVELWRTDGTAAGTALVRDVRPGYGSSNPAAITPIGGGRCVFTAAASGSDREPWVTDGTAAGTVQLADVAPGAAGSDPQHYDVVAGRLWFDATIDGAARTVRLDVAGPARYGQGCAGSGSRVPRMDSSGGSTIGTTIGVSVHDAAANSFAALVYSGGSHPATLGGCTILVDLPELGMLLAPVFGDTATIAIPIPNNPDLVGLEFFLQWAVIDPTGPLFGFSLSDGLRVTIE